MTKQGTGCNSGNTIIRICVLILLLTPGLVALGQQKKVCFTMDDMPVVSYGITDTNYQKNLFNKLTQSLRRHNIPAIGFVIGKKLYTADGIDQFQVRLLESWLNSGLDLGNHTYSHPDYNSVTLKEYIWNIEQGEPITKKLLADHGKALKYFRHPYLHVGNTKGKADSLSDYLSARGYTVAPVTIDNDDYLFAVAYKRAQDKNDRSLMTQIGSDYTSYLEKKLHYYERQAKNLFGRAINQILLFHASALNSDYGDSLALMFVRNNYSFVSLDKALEDPVYKTEVTSFGNYGISWLDRWALSRGKTGEYFKDDPVPPDYVKKMSK